MVTSEIETVALNAMLENQRFIIETVALNAMLENQRLIIEQVKITLASLETNDERIRRFVHERI